MYEHLITRLRLRKMPEKSKNILKKFIGAQRNGFYFSGTAKEELIQQLHYLYIGRI